MFVTRAAVALLMALPLGAAAKKALTPPPDASPEVMWKNPSDIASRDLFYGPGGKADQPPSRVTFVKEDLEGINPKFVERDANGVKWKVKLGFEACPETAASRLVWAAGYFADEDYFVRDLKVDNLPQHLHRGQNLVSADGSVHNIRLKRELTDVKKIGSWHWTENRFSGTRELNGLRVMMALINNWDLTDENTAIYKRHSEGQPERIYTVSDVGASFGTPRLTWPLKQTRGDLDAYEHSKFITHETIDYLDFANPSRASLFMLFQPREYRLRLGERWIGRHIPREDAKWIGQKLARLSPAQIRDAFRAAGYSKDLVDGFSAVIETRIAELRDL